MIDGVPLGIWYCRPCAQMRPFISFAADPDKRDPNLAECEWCGFVFGKKIDQGRTDEHTGRRITVVEGVLSEEVIARGRQRLRDQQVSVRRRMGIPLRAPRELTNELKRRRGGM